MIAADDPDLLWRVNLTTDDEHRWRDTLGGQDLADWVAAHGWNWLHVITGSVVVFGYDNGTGYVNADVLPVDHHGAIIGAPRTAVARLARSLPEGIGTVSR